MRTVEKVNFDIWFPFRESSRKMTSIVFGESIWVKNIIQRDELLIIVIWKFSVSDCLRTDFEIRLNDEEKLIGKWLTIEPDQKRKIRENEAHSIEKILILSRSLEFR